MWAGWAVAAVLGSFHLANAARADWKWWRSDSVIHGNRQNQKATNPIALLREDLIAVRRELSALSRDMHSARKTTEGESQSAFAILQEELNRKTKEIELIRLGNDYRSKRPLLISLARAFDIIAHDGSCQNAPAETTLKGVGTELREAIEDHGIVSLLYPQGTCLAEALAIDHANSTRMPSMSDDDKGKISETLRPAYVLKEGDNIRDILIPALVRYYA